MKVKMFSTALCFSDDLQKNPSVVHTVGCLLPAFDISDLLSSGIKARFLCKSKNDHVFMVLA